MAATRDGMVLVPAGPFLMGSDEFARETPPHTVDLPAFWIDRFPVTNHQFRAFVAATGHRRPVDWVDDAPRPGTDQRASHALALFFDAPSGGRA